MDELDSLIDQFKKTYSLSQNNLKPCELFKGKLDNESFPILPPIPSYLSLSSDEVIRLFCEVVKPGIDNFVSKVYEITTSGILCQLIYQIGPVTYQDLSKLQIFGLIPFDMISPGVIKKIKALCRSNSSLHFLALIEEIAQMKQTLVNSYSSTKVDFDPKTEIDTYSTQKMNTVTSTKPLLILSIAKNDKEVERSNDLNQISLVQLNFYRSLFEPENDSSKELEGETNDYTTLIQMHPSFHNLSCYSNVLQTEKINVRGTPFTFLKDLKNVDYPKDCLTFAATLRKKQAHSWALPSIKKGIHYFNTSRNPEALQCYNKALQIDPTNAEALVARGAMYATCLNFDKAVQDFSEAISHDPNHGNAHKYLGQTLVTKAKRLEKELGKLEKKKKLLEAIDEENERATVARIKILRSQIVNYYYQASIHMPESESVNFKLKEYGIITEASAKEQRTSIMRGDGPSTPASTGVEVLNDDDSDASSATSQNSSASSVTTSSSQSSGSVSSVSSRFSSSASRSPSITSVSTQSSSGKRSNERQKRVKKRTRASPYSSPSSQREVVEAPLNGNFKRFKYSPLSLNKSKRNFTPRSDSLTPSPIILLPSPDEDPEFWFQNMNWTSPLLTSTSPHYPRDYSVDEQGPKHSDEHYSLAENNRQTTKSSEKQHKYTSHESARKFKSEGHKKRPAPNYVEDNHRQNNFNKNLGSNTKRQSDKGEKKNNKELQDMESFLETLKRKASTTSTISK